MDKPNMDKPVTARSPFERLIDPQQFDALPAPVRRLHSLRAPAYTRGRADITASANPLAWIIRLVAGLPNPGRDVPVTVSFLPDGKGRELWKRLFGGRRYASVMAVGQDRSKSRSEGQLIEYFGPFRLFSTLEPRGAAGLAWKIERWGIWNIPLPRWSAPSINCLECADGERFVFDIDVAFPIVGHVMHYRGWLTED